ncbi:hypothetical protein JOQ06_030094, partial [Pogonophryne albipinna]
MSLSTCKRALCFVFNTFNVEKPDSQRSAARKSSSRFDMAKSKMDSIERSGVVALILLCHLTKIFVTANLEVNETQQQHPTNVYHDMGVTRNKIVTAQFECYQKIMKDDPQGREEMVNKICTDSGVWFLHPESNRTWTNYTRCTEHTNEGRVLGVNAQSLDDKSPCHLPEAPGPCRGLLTRYFFDSMSQQCKHLFYGGCFGNANNFRSMADCQAKCQNPEVKPTDLCLSPVERGTCDGSEKRFAFNSNTKRCHAFHYSGCEGNENNFQSRKDCIIKCINAERTRGLCNGIPV